MSDKKPWAGRFNEPTDAFVEAFTASVDFDRRMAFQDIEGSLAHARMLFDIGVLDAEELGKIEDGLGRVQGEIEDGSFSWSVELEDVHMNIESRLTELIGDTGKKLHTGRSRNDQVATDIRLYLREQIAHSREGIRPFQHGLLDLAEREAHTILPGFMTPKWPSAPGMMALTTSARKSSPALVSILVGKVAGLAISVEV